MYVKSIAKIVAFLSSVLLIVLLAACSDDPTEPEKDTTPPAKIVDLQVDSTNLDTVYLSWTAPGDDGNLGTASAYDIRYAIDSTTLLGWTDATVVSEIHKPAPVGSTETLAVGGLTVNTLYFFAIKATDEYNNTSEISDFVSHTSFNDVATNITLETFCGVGYTNIDTQLISTEGQVFLPLSGDSSGCCAIAHADGFYTEIYYAEDWEPITVDLDPVLQFRYAVTGVIIVYGLFFNYFNYYANESITITGPNGTWSTTTDEQGRYFIGELPYGTYTLSFICEGEPISFEITNTSGTDYEYLSVIYQMQVLAPNIYLYPESEMDVSVELGFPFGGHVTESEPLYGDGWKVRVDQNGIIEKEYEYLFYEASLPVPMDYSTGWLLDGNDLGGEFRRLLEKLGFIGREVDDFVEYWKPMLEGSPWYVVYPQDVDAMITLHATPAPSSVLRVLLLIYPLDYPLTIPEPDISNPFIREGFTIVEWGVIAPLLSAGNGGYHAPW